MGKIYIADVFLKIGGTSSEYLMSDGSVSNSSSKANIVSPTFSGTVTLPSTTSIGNVSSTEIGFIDGVTSNVQNQLNAKLTIVTGTTNFLPKVTGTNIFGNSRLWDTGNFFGVDTTIAPTKDVTLGNQTSKVIGIEDSDSSTIGRDLTTSAGRAINFQLSANWTILANIGNSRGNIGIHPNKDVYVPSNGAIYKQIGGTGAFSSIGFSANWSSVACTPNGDIYASINGGSIYKQTGGVGSFDNLNQTNRAWTGLSVHPNGNIYASVLGGDLYVRLSGATDFTPLNQTVRNWQSIACANNGDVYACVINNDIYLQTNGTGNFIAMSQTQDGGNWFCLACAPNGNIYVGTYNNGIYVRTGGVGNFIRVVPNSAGNVGSIGVDANNSIYHGSWNGGPIYFQNNYAIGVANLDGGTYKAKAGTGKGTGKSLWQVWTGQKTTSGTDMQVETLRMEVNEEGLTTLPSTTVAVINADTTGKSVVTKEYLAVSQITITTSVNITTDTLDASSFGQKGRNVILDNGGTAINLVVNGGVGFSAGYMKFGTGAITFLAGVGRTLVTVDGTAVLNGVVGSTATITSVGTVDYLRISNAI